MLGVFLFLTRFARSGIWLLVISNLLFAVVGLSPLAYALILPLEDRFPHWDARGSPDGIIVLGGTIDPGLSAARNEVSLSESAERLTAIAALARRYPAVSIVFSGGPLSPPQHPNEAQLTARIFESFGISPERLMHESRSRNTAENATFTRALIGAKTNGRWLLVTSAVHMPRAVGAFRKAGFLVEAYPVDWQTTGRENGLSFFRSPLDGLRLCDIAAHEWAGLLVYWLSGKTTALFPAP